MKRLAQIAAFVVVALLSSCNSKECVRNTEAIYTPRYAQGFAIERDTTSGEVLLCVKNPWQGAEDIRFCHTIDTVAAARRIVAMSSSHVAMIDAIGCADRIVGISGCRFISTPSAVKAIDEGRIAEVGYDAAFDFEKIRSLRADIVLLYGVAGEAKILTNKLDELAIPYIYIGDYLENDPLGKAEWVVALAYLCGVPNEGKAFFEGVEKRYNALRNRKHCSAYRPRVMLNLPYRDTWFMPPRNSYMVRLIEDAGGAYILTENGKRKAENGPDAAEREQRELARFAEPQGRKACVAGLKRKAENDNSTTPISLEEALVLASQADFWINLGQITSFEELCAAAPRFTKVDAVKFRRLYNNTKRTNASRGSDFWESGAIRPDLILEDLVKILHYEAPTEQLYYYKKME
ncbi:MAG: ABC transporter substrate-binding protein [Alistipes sp.]|nr:ABC transporter substrate-binding protein [Alistipes sp.]